MNIAGRQSAAVRDDLFTPLRGKNVFFSGGTGGIGLYALTALVRMGADVFLVANNRTKAIDLIESIRRKRPAGTIHYLDGNLSSLKNTAAVAEQFLSLNIPLHLLINGAAVYGLRDRQLSEEGIEMTFMVNFLAPYLLTRKLLTAIRASGPARIVNVSSLMYSRISENNFEMAFRNYNADQGYSHIKQYALSKLGLIYFSSELAHRLDQEHITTNSLHPGMVFTDMSKTMNPMLIKLLKTSFFQSMWSTPEQAAETYLNLCVSPSVAGISGQFFNEKNICKLKNVAADPSRSMRFWELGEELTKDYLYPTPPP